MIARFLADENVPSSVIRWLKSCGYDARRTTEVPGAGASGLAIVRQAHGDNRLILTRPRFRPLASAIKAALRSHCGEGSPTDPERVEDALNRVISQADIEKAP